MTGADRADSGRGDEPEAGRADARAARDSRQDRLKAALRANLRRRKSQARGRSKQAGGGDGDGPD